MQDFFFVRSDNRNVKISYSQLVYVELVGNYAKLYLTDDKFFMVLISLKQMESLLPLDFFCRIHRSYIVGVMHLTAFDAKKAYIGDLSLPISETYKERLAKRFPVVADKNRQRRNRSLSPMVVMNSGKLHDKGEID